MKGSKEQQKYGKEKMKGHKKYMISFYKSIVDQDRASIVICNLKHEIIYMNPAAVLTAMRSEAVINLLEEAC